MKDNSGHSEGGEVPKLTKALEVARTLPCACSDCGMRETESAKKILEFAESLAGSVAAPKPDYLNEDQKLVHEIYGAHDAAGEGINKLFDRLSLLKDELAAAKESIKELVQIVDNHPAMDYLKLSDQFHPVLNMKAKSYKEASTRAKTLLDNH